MSGVDFAEAARVMYEALPDRFTRPEQCYPAIAALNDAGFLTPPSTSVQTAAPTFHETGDALKVERAAIREYLIACADTVDAQRLKYNGSIRVVCNLRVESKAYRNAARMIDEEDHASYRSTLTKDASPALKTQVAAPESTATGSEIANRPQLGEARESVALLPCPFCGGRGQTSKDSDPRYPWFVRFQHVDTCPLMFVHQGNPQSYRTEQAAIAAWNTRAPTNLEAVREACAQIADAEAERDDQFAPWRCAAKTIAAAIRNTDFTKGERG